MILVRELLKNTRFLSEEKSGILVKGLRSVEFLSNDRKKKQNLPKDDDLDEIDVKSTKQKE